MENGKNNPIIDLHSHILPQMDDGSQDVQTSVQMLRRLAEQGVDTVCATPHFYARQESIDRFLCRRMHAFSQLNDTHMDANDFRWPAIQLGAEIAYFPGVSECAGLEQLCLTGTRTLLLELSYTQWTPQQVEDVASLSLDHGYQVILAHPERYAHIKTFQADMERLLSLPVALQMDADSLLSWRRGKLALQRLESTLFPLLGSDCHDLSTRPPRLAQARQVVARKLGKEMLEKLDETALIWTQNQTVETWEV